MKIPLSYSFRNIWARRLTSALTLGGIGLVVFVFAAVLMLAAGIRETMVSTGSLENAIVIRKSAQTEMISAVSRESAAIARNLPQVARTAGGAPFASCEMSVIINLLKKGSNDMGNVTVRGVMPAGLALRPQVRIVSGRMFREGMTEIIVGMSIHERFNGCEIGERIRFGGRWWTIVGIFDGAKTAFDSEVWGDVEQLLPAFGRPVFSAVTLRLTRPEDFDAFRRTFETDRRLQQLDVKREKLFFAEQSETMALFISILGITITIIFSVGAMVGAMITMYSAVANRTREIGTLRALGFRRRSILASFLIEAVFLSFLGGLLGVALASLLQFVTVSTVNWGSFSEIAFGFTLDSSIAVNAIIFALVMGLVGGFLPAIRASRMNILAALRAA